MKLLLIAITAFSLSFNLFAKGCLSAYKQQFKATRKTMKDHVAGAMILGAVSSSAAIVSFGAGSPSLGLTATALFGAGEYLSGDQGELHRETGAIIGLLRDSKLGKGPFLEDATTLIQQHFQDKTITQAEVASAIQRQDAKKLYCQDKKLKSLAGILSMAGKSIIAERAITQGRNVYDKSRGFHEEKDHGTTIEKKIPSQAEDR